MPEWDAVVESLSSTLSFWLVRFAGVQGPRASLYGYGGSDMCPYHHMDGQSKPSRCQVGIGRYSGFSGPGPIRRTQVLTSVVFLIFGRLCLLIMSGITEQRGVVPVDHYAPGR